MKTLVLVAASLLLSCHSSTGGGVPNLRHVFVIMMENTSLATLAQSQRAPYLKSLSATAATSANYHGVTHPSLPNYLALTSGGTQGVTCDCNPSGTACTSCGDCNCSQAAAHLGDQLEAAGLTWRAYGEDMGAACNTTSSGGYATRHVPFLYFSKVQGDAKR